MNQLKKRLAEIERKLEHKKLLQKNLSREINALIEKVNLIKNNINPPEITISDHALIRYIERFSLIPLDEYKESINNRFRESIYKINGNGSLTIDNIKIICKDFNIVTIVNKDLETD